MRIHIEAAFFAAVALAGAAHAADADAGRVKAAPCTGCHGERGSATLPLTPSLASQPPLYVQMQIILYREKQRDIPQMTPFVQGLSDADVEDIAAFFAAQPMQPSAAPADTARARSGERIAAANHCGSCHLPDFTGREQMPRLAGQREDYLVKAMQDYRDARRSGFDGMMTSVLRGYTDRQIADLAHYFSRLR